MQPLVSPCALGLKSWHLPSCNINMARKHIHLSPEAEERERGKKSKREAKRKSAAVQNTKKETEPVRDKCDKKYKELTSQIAAGWLILLPSRDKTSI